MNSSGGYGLMDKKTAFCVIDVGTGGVKCMVFEATGKLVYKESSEINFHFDSYAISFDPVDVWKDVCRMTRAAVKECSKQKLKIASVSSTSMREGNVFYDGEGSELLAVPNLDARAYNESEELSKSLGEAIYISSGHWPSPIFLASRLKYLQKNKGDLFSKIRSVSLVNDWILYKFSGNLAVEPTNGCETALFSLRKRSWDEQLIRDCGFERSMFPEVKECGTVLGQVSRSAGRASGLEEKVQVVVGAADTESAVAGCGLFEPGNVAAVAGTTTPVQAVTSDPLLDPERRTWTCCHVLPGTWTVESNAGGTGLLMKWWGEMTGKSFSDLDREVEREKPAPMKVRVNAGTSVMNARRPHPTVGSISGVSSWTPRSWVTLGILETNCFSVRANLEQLESVLATKFQEVYFCGGASKSRLWRTLQAGILGRTLVSFGVGEATGRGAAMLSAVATGSFPDLKSAAKSFLKQRLTTKPDPRTFETYDSLYGEWLKETTK